MAIITTATVEDILRPLAEATVVEHQDEKGFHVEGEGLDCPSCGTPRHIPDPRFLAIRTPFIVANDRLNTYATSGGIDASLGAIVRAAAACGRWEIEKVLAALLLWCDASQWDEKFLTPEEAAARALVAAVGEQKKPAQGDVNYYFHTSRNVEKD